MSNETKGGVMSGEFRLPFRLVGIGVPFRAGAGHVVRVPDRQRQAGIRFVCLFVCR